VARLLLARGANVNATQAEGFTALHEAAFAGDAALAKILLDAGANKSQKTPEGETAEDIARKRKHPEVAALLESVQ
jgi:ankyrin repeat protein